MSNPTMTTVVFRKWKHSGEIIALFPDIKEPGGCQSYMQVGQHGAAWYEGVVRATIAAKGRECYPLIDELQSLGYTLRIRSRKPTA